MWGGGFLKAGKRGQAGLAKRVQKDSVFQNGFQAIFQHIRMFFKDAWFSGGLRWSKALQQHEQSEHDHVLGLLKWGGGRTTKASRRIHFLFLAGEYLPKSCGKCVLNKAGEQRRGS